MFRISNRLPRRPSARYGFTLVLVVTGLMVVWSGWNITAAYQNTARNHEQYLRIIELRGAITQLDTVLTLSAQLAVVTGDPRWETQYHAAESDLTVALDNLSALVPQNTSVAATQTASANQKLLVLEKQAFTLMHAGQRDAAQAVLKSAAYQEQKRRYAAEVALLLGDVQTQVRYALGDTYWRMASMLGVALFGCMLALGSWLLVMRAMAREHAALQAQITIRQHTEDTLHHTHAELAHRNQQLAQTLTTWNAVRLTLDLPTLFAEIVQAAHVSLGFETVVLNLIDAQRQNVTVHTYAGLDAAGRELLDGAVYPWETFAQLMQPSFQIGRCFFITEGTFNWELDFTGPVYEGPLDNGRLQNKSATAWHPNDALFVPIELRDGRIVGILSVDRPLDGQRPTPAAFQVLDIFSTQAAIAIENAHLYAQIQHELTERTNAAMALVVAKDAAEQANRAKSTFLATMSHELRTPLTAILGYSELLQKAAHQGDTAQLVEDLQHIRSAGTHLLTLINQALDLSKIEAGKMMLAVGPVNLQLLIDDVFTYIRPLADRQNNRLVTYGVEGIGTIETDALKLRQILINVLSNATKFTEQGTITLAVVRETHTQGDWITFVVRDTGIGMTDEQVGQLFQAFTQVGDGARMGGTGLGLALSRHLCELLGGDITVSSTLGVGSIFTVHLPGTILERNTELLPVRETPALELLPRTDEMPLALRADAPLVLIIDDDRASRDLIARSLSQAGWTPVTAATGAEGIRRAIELWPDVITLDMNLPDIDGATVLQTLQATPEVAAIPVLVLTVDDNIDLQALPGVVDALVKPIDQEQLLALVQATCSIPG